MRPTVKSPLLWSSVEPFHPGYDAVPLRLAPLTDREALIVATRHPDLAAERLDLVSGDVAPHLIVSHHDVGDGVGVTLAGPGFRLVQGR